MLPPTIFGILGLALLMSGSPAISASRPTDSGVWEGTGRRDVAVAASSSCAVAASESPSNLGPID